MMDVNSNKSSPSSSSTTTHSEDEMMSDLRRGPWTVEEDLKLINYIATHGEGRWNSLARCAGLKRTGKSCRLRWLNYLRPDVRRGNITLEEQVMILDLHSKWGNRWSKIAQHLPGRTDNEIKNYWRTRVQKHAKQLKCDVNSKQFKDTMKYLWMPRLIERIQAANTRPAAPNTTEAANQNFITAEEMGGCHGQWAAVAGGGIVGGTDFGYAGNFSQSYATPESSSIADSFGTQVSPVSDMNNNNDYYTGVSYNQNLNQDYFQSGQVYYSDSIISPTGYYNQGLDFQGMEQNNVNSVWLDGGDTTDNLWNDIWFNNNNM